NTLVPLVDGTYTTNASKNGNSCFHAGCACTSAEVGKCVCAKSHEHTKNASVGARTSTVRGQKVTVTKAAWEGRAAPTPLEREALEQISADSSHGGQGGDRYKKSEGGGRSSGNRKGSEAAFEPFLQDAPGVALICAKDGCTQEWGQLLGVRRRNGGQPGVARGIYDEATKIVFVKEEKHRADKGQFRSKPGATVTKDGVVYSVRSTQPRYLNKVAHALRKTPA
ncbi:unnamed protein product, partial [Pylaiella littoralis]